MIKKNLEVFFLILVFLFSFQVKSQNLDVEEFTLDNGLKVYLSENPHQNKVFGAVVVKVGGKNDPKDNTGMAHYLEHMLFKGTTTMGTTNYQEEKVFLDSITEAYTALGKTEVQEKRDSIQKKINDLSVKAAEYAIPNEFDRIISEMGGTKVNAFTTEDFTAYFNEFPPHEIAKWLDVYVSRFDQPVFRLFQSELEVVYEEKNRGSDDGFSMLFENYLKHFFKNHPYGQQTIIGKTEHLKNPALDVMYDYFNTYYVPNNMALVLSGNFKTEEVIPIIKEKFNVLEAKEVPEFPNYEEDDFNGKEKIKGRYLPIKVMVAGYRTPELGHEDIPAIDVIHNLLSNEAGTGFLDELGNNGEVLASGAFQLPYVDYGASFVFVVPKIIGQSFKKAERKLNGELEKLKSGDFSEQILESTKLKMLQSREREMESNQNRALMIGETFVQGKSWKSNLEYNSKLSNLRKEDIIEVAKKYFGENKLVMYSKMGFPKKDKLSKPNFKSVKPKDSLKSEYYQYLSSIKSPELKATYLNFEKDIVRSTVNGVEVQTVKNPYNELYNIEISWGIGTEKNPKLKELSTYLNSVGSLDYNYKKFNDSLYSLGATFWTSASPTEFKISIEGADEHLDKVLGMVDKFILSPEKNEKKTKKVVDEEKAEKRFSNSSPIGTLFALNQYVKHKEDSYYLKQTSLKELKKYSPKDYINLFNEVKEYQARITYSGSKDHQEMETSIKNHLSFVSGNKARLKKVFKPAYFDEKTTVYFVNSKKAKQSQILLQFPTDTIDNLEQYAKSNLFNQYFGADMSSLVFQEIREFRSLAYSTYGRIHTNIEMGNSSSFLGYLGCQDDKTNDAISAMINLVDSMPQKADRESYLKNALVNKAKTAKPQFRDIAKKINMYESYGHNSDPNQKLVEYYEALNFQNILEVYNNQIQGKPKTIMIVGNKKRIDMKQLSEYGEIIEVKAKDLYSK